MKKIAAGVLAAAMGGALLISGGSASATASRATLDVQIEDINPNPVIITKNGVTTARFDVIASEAAEKVELLVRPTGNQPRTLVAKDVKVDHKGEHWIFTVPFSAGDPVGKWRATATAYDKDKKSDTDKAYFAVEEEQGKADTRISRFSANPDPVRKGKSLWFKGRLQVDEDHHWSGYDDAEVGIYFRASGSSGWKWVADADTDRRGNFVTRTKAWKSGTFKAVYEGDEDTNASESRHDWVRVYRGYRH